MQYIVQNSGVVLLCPFLPTLFSTLNLTKDQKFISGTERARAVYLMEYLVTGLENIADTNFPLIKLLCNMDGESIPGICVLSSRETEECDELLHAIILRWAGMDSSSIAGLRSSFLNRPGILEVQNGKSSLFVERRTYDILLDKIPWSYAYAKLPWMENILEVEW